MIPRAALFRLFRILFWLTLGIITILASIPVQNDLSQPFEHTDKVKHFAAFFVMAGLYAHSFKTGPFAMFFYLFLFGVLIEGVQYFLPYRSADVYDLVADAAGIVGYLALMRTFRLAKNLRHRSN